MELEDEAGVALLPGGLEKSHQKPFSMWQFWKFLIVFLILVIISVWLVFTMFPSVLASTRTSSSTKTSFPNTDKCSLVPQDTSNASKWSGFVEIVPGTLIYSAYYDDTNKTSPLVRMIGISKTLKQPRLFCHSRCDPTKTEEAKFVIVKDHKFRRHAAFIITCSFPRGLGRDPGFISISALFDKKRTQVVDIPVQSTEDQRHVHNYTVCVPPIYGTAITAMNFVEFVEMNRILGASNFIIYNEYVHPRLQKVVEYYEKQGVAKVLPWNLPPYLKDFYSIHYHGQQVSIEDCLYRNRGKAKWVGFHDLDEFIVPLNHSSVAAMLDAVETPKAAGYCIRSILFPRNVELKQKKDRNRIDEVLLTQHYFYRTKSIFKTRKRSKCIVDPRKVFDMGIHYISQTLPGYQETWLNQDIALVFHYRQCVRYDDLKLACKQLVFEAFMLRYGVPLRNNVDHVMRLIT